MSRTSPADDPAGRQGAVAADGFAVVPDVLAAPEVARLLAALNPEEPPGAAAAAASRRGGSVYAVRNLLAASDAVRDAARSDAVRGLAAPFLGRGCFCVRALLFDKVPGANWNLAWHQDVSVAVRARRDAPGWGPWSSKAGVAHVQPPAAVLEQMLAVRLHLDACGADNGPLRVLPGTHRLGRLDAGQIAGLRRRIAEVACLVPAGGAVLMRPLLLHASSAAALPGHRRVLHLEFAADPLTHGLEWFERVGAEGGEA